MENLNIDELEEKLEALYEKIDDTAEDSPEWKRLHAQADNLSELIKELQKLNQEPQDEADFSGSTNEDR